MQATFPAQSIAASERRTLGGRALPFLAPALILYSVLRIYPLLNALVMSFYRWDGILA
ncbi:hypothetical protein [Candidatus Flexifilum breve]|uniref:hypothetical protein n=1 Tax=Candidatus Flexifilum breve TaxID=3140694 RepID=UPI0031CC7146